MNSNGKLSFCYWYCKDCKFKQSMTEKEADAHCLYHTITKKPNCPECDEKMEMRMGT